MIIFFDFGVKVPRVACQKKIAPRWPPFVADEFKLLDEHLALPNVPRVPLEETNDIKYGLSYT
jgi:hypothetical protein